MPRSDQVDIDTRTPPFDRFRNLHRLGSDRSGHGSGGQPRHRLYVGRDKRDRVDALIKLTARPGLVYEHNLSNEIESLAAINRELPNSRYFPFVRDHGRLRDGRLYLIASLFDELPLAASLDKERVPGRLVAHLRTAIAVSRALVDLHGLAIFHVDLNPMNILYRLERATPVIRIVDFESSYHRARHASGIFYDPPTTPGYSAPEVSRQPPDARADVFSLGTVLYTMIAGYRWPWTTDVWTSVDSDRDTDPELRTIVRMAVDPNPDCRYESIQEFGDALGHYLERIWPGRSG